MFFLPAELVKEARNEVLSHWMETVQRHENNLGYQFSRAWNDSGFVSCQTVQRLFPTLQVFASSKQNKKGRKKERKKSVSSFDSSISGSGRFFLFFPVLVVKFLWWLWWKCCCIVVLQTNGIQCVKKSMHVLYFTSNNFTQGVTISRNSVFKV